MADMKEPSFMEEVREYIIANNNVGKKGFTVEMAYKIESQEAEIKRLREIMRHVLKIAQERYDSREELDIIADIAQAALTKGE